jgi:F-type H+-transporting ATPase subunit delta
MNPSAEQAPRHETVMDASEQRVARVYAEALLNAAQQRGAVDEVLEEFRALFENVFGTDPRFEVSLSSGAISRRSKAEMIHRIFDGRASETFRNFLLVLNEHERLGLLGGIYQEARRLHDERQGRMQVVVHSAVPLPEEQREMLREQLRATFHKEPMLEERVDPELLGGLVVRVGDWLYDASVRTRLDHIRNQLIERSSHEIQSRRDHFCTDAGN